MLTFRSLLSSAETPEIRFALLSKKVEDMLNTVVRQISFYSFERKVHLARREGELKTDDINRMWLEVSEESSVGDHPQRGLRHLLGLYPATSSIRPSMSMPMPSAIAW